jgi:hypothetical protein
VQLHNQAITAYMDQPEAESTEPPARLNLTRFEDGWPIELVVHRHGGLDGTADCDEWLAEPTAIFYNPFNNNVFHYFLDGILAVFPTLQARPCLVPSNAVPLVILRRLSTLGETNRALLVLYPYLVAMHRIGIPVMYTLIVRARSVRVLAAGSRNCRSKASWSTWVRLRRLGPQIYGSVSFNGPRPNRSWRS